MKRFRIAFSFAGEKRDFVAEVAAILAKQFGQDAILYDKFHELAALAQDRKDWPQAETLARQALPLSEKVGRQQLIALDCGRLAKALVRQGKSAEALPYAQRSVEIYTRLGHPDLKFARATVAECEA
ncbi:MAG: tetratricopeptide repeat protein [Acidobacteriota bacterium]|nr:tetratricopeptide repeat protein [Acidobacteriota bacterium]